MAGLEAWEGGIPGLNNGKKRYSVGLEQIIKKRLPKKRLRRLLKMFFEIYASYINISLFPIF